MNPPAWPEPSRKSKTQGGALLALLITACLVVGVLFAGFPRGLVLGAGGAVAALYLLLVASAPRAGMSRRDFAADTLFPLWAILITLAVLYLLLFS